MQVINKPVLLYKASSQNSSVRKFAASALMAVSFGVVSLQAGFVLNASASNNPISSPISYSATPTPTPVSTQCPTGKVAIVVGSTVICISQNQSQTQTQNQGNTNSNTNNPVTSPEVTNTNTQNNPVTSPEVSPSPSTSPVTAPEVVTPTPTPTPSSQPSSSNNNGNNSSNNNSNGGGSSSGSNSAPSCNNEAPKAPYIVSAVTSGKNEITLNWTKPAGNVTHYSVAYGVIKNKPLYGASNIGNVTSFKVKGLSGGGTYFFIVKAVNDCTPSVASNEVGVKVGGQFISTPAQGFKAGVLGKNTKVVNQSVKPAASQQPIPGSPIFEVKPNTGLVGKVVSFFKGIFN